MIAGHLQEKKGLFYIVLNCKDECGKRKPKWIPTGLPLKGNKKKAEGMLLEARQNFEATLQAEELAKEQVAAASADDPTDEEQVLFADFMEQWLEMMKYRVEITTHASYTFGVNGRIVPYFREKGIFLQDVQPKHLHDFYHKMLKEYHLSSGTLQHFHAYIRQALQYAFKMDMIPSNPADKAERPKRGQFIGSFYDSRELNQLFEAVKGDSIELAVLLTSFYGLRRSEIAGLKWKAINFQNQTLTIQHTVIPVSYGGKQITLEKDRAKNKASHRTLPLVPAFQELLQRILEEQQKNQALYKDSYSKAYKEYIYVDKLGERIKPGYITQHFPIILGKNEMRRIRFHDLRHSCASLLLANGVSMKEIQEWLGHSHFSTTANIYAHLDYSSKISSAQVMSNVLSFLPI
ncbi:site-specific integrase [Paenibacillus sp. S150]|uniref:tyrosine-type recombinase/integrase n=1 Tax=Paenibacillus sp. S150 TaxID=2749826 RepID=UPI001C622885|nr:site-specific integrase [Paenibacillus sp. S150]MBW4084985.1 site-specific integrase [Paenibacillus sp. S150]